MRYLEDIKSKLIVEDAINLSDKEIQRCLGDCVCGHWLVPMAKKYREDGLLVLMYGVFIPMEIDEQTKLIF